MGGGEWPVVADPVQDAGVRAGRRDGLVSRAVPLGPRAQVEDPLDPAFAAGVAQGVGQGAYHVLEAHRRVVDGELELAHLPGVLEQPEFGERGVQLGVSGGGVGTLGQQAVDAGVDAGEEPGRRLRSGEEPGQFVQGSAAQPGQRGRLVQVGPAAHPELAVAAVAVEVAGVPGGAGADVEQRLVAVRAGRFEDEDMVGLLLAGQAGQPGVGAVRAEAVVGVVRPDLERSGGYDQPFAREARRQPLDPARQQGAAGHPRVGGQRGGRPAGGHEGVQGRRDRQVVAARVRSGGGRGGGHGSPSEGVPGVGREGRGKGPGGSVAGHVSVTG